VVVGQSRACELDNSFSGSFDIGENLARGHPERIDPVFCRPRIAIPVMPNLIRMVMDHAVDFDRQPCVAAVEVQRIVTRLMLPTKLEAIRTLPQ
jgi:hypothetical protein